MRTCHLVRIIYNGFPERTNLLDDQPAQTMSDEYDRPRCPSGNQIQKAPVERRSKGIQVLEALALRNCRVIAKDHNARARLIVAFLCDVVGEYISQPHVLSAPLFEGSESVSTEAGNGDNTSAISALL